MPIYPSPITEIYTGKDGKLTPRFFKKEPITIEEQHKLNSYYMNVDEGDSGAGVIRDAKADGLKEGQSDTRCTILAVVHGGLALFEAWKRTLTSLFKENCATVVSRLAQNEIDWIKQMDQKHYDDRKKDSKFLLPKILRMLTLAVKKIMLKSLD